MSATVTLRRAFRPGETVAAHRHASVPILASVSGDLRLRLSAPDLPPVFQRQRIEPGAFTVPIEAASPILVPGAVDVEPSAVVVPVVFGSPAIEPGATTLEPAPLEATVGVPSLDVQPGVVELRPGAVAAPAVLPPPAVQPGAVSVAPAAFKPTVSVPSPMVSRVESTFFSDEFDGAAGAPLGERTGWLSVGGTGSMALTGSGELDANNPNNSGASYTSPDIGTVDHWVEAVIAAGSSAVPGPAIACRLFNANNHVGVRWSTAGFELYSRTNGTITILAVNALVPKASDVVRLTVKGPQGTALLNGVPLFAATVPETARTTQGLVARGAIVTPFVRSYRAGAS